MIYSHNSYSVIYIIYIYLYPSLSGPVVLAMLLVRLTMHDEVVRVMESSDGSSETDSWHSACRAKQQLHYALFPLRFHILINDRLQTRQKIIDVAYGLTSLAYYYTGSVFRHYIPHIL